MLITEDRACGMEQAKEAERMAAALKGAPKDKEILLVTMANVFISGLEAGAKLTRQTPREV